MVRKFVTHSKKVLGIAAQYGWLPGAKYNNLRNVKHLESIGFLDIDWKKYDFHRHLDAAAQIKPILTVARDVEDYRDLDCVLSQASELSAHCEQVIVVPKDIRLAGLLDSAIPTDFLLGFSVPTKYGGTNIPPESFQRPVHLLGGRPDVQRKLADVMPVLSLDCNRFTLDASFGDYFDGERFRPHPVGGYETCLKDSLANINEIWIDHHLISNGHG